MISECDASRLAIYISLGHRNNNFFFEIHKIYNFVASDLTLLVKSRKTKTSAKHVITTPFADDFNVISRNTKQHQSLVTDVENKLLTMGLVLKASKCRSLSIKNGTTTNIQFHLKNQSEDAIPI